MWETSTTLSVAGRSIMTLTGPRRSFPALIRHLDGSTPRRRLFRRVTAAVAQTPLFRLVVDQAAPPPSSATLALLESIDAARPSGQRPAASMAVLHAISSWPGRAYVVALDADDQPLFFAKVSDQPTDGPRFEREHRMLDDLQVRPLDGWRAPRGRGVVDGDGVVALVTDCLPTGSANLTGPEVLGRIPLRRRHEPLVVERDPQDLDWLPPALERAASPAFGRLLDGALRGPIATSFAHADIGTRNTFRVPGSEPWLVDWEFATEHAPRATDLVAGELNITLEVDTSSLPALWRMLCTFASAHNFTREELALALLYLADHKHERAGLLVSSLEGTDP